MNKYQFTAMYRGQHLAGTIEANSYKEADEKLNVIFKDIYGTTEVQYEIWEIRLYI